MNCNKANNVVDGGLRNAKTGLVPFSLEDIKPSPENLQIYRPVLTDDPEIIELAASIKKHGLRSPIIVTLDGFIISGHRRYAASQLAGLETVRCIVEPFRREDDLDRFLTLLREDNRQREKTISEKAREEIVSIDKTQAYRRLQQHRRESARINVKRFFLRNRKDRPEISSAKRPMLDAISKVLKDRRDFLPQSVRATHYALLNDPPLIHASKPNSIYKNDLKSYKRLVDLLTRARLSGFIPFDSISDETRPVETWSIFPSVTPFMRQEFNDFLRGYYRDLLQSQPNHIELLAEKNTVSSVLSEVAGEFTVPVTIGRGYASLPPRQEMAQRYFDSGKEKLILLVASDFDPDGEEICHSFARSMRDDFGVSNIFPIKVALTADQVAERNLPPSVEAKVSSSRYKRFFKKYGRHAYELEALQPKDLQATLRKAIKEVIDLDAFNRETAKEADEAGKLEGIRISMTKQLGSLDLED